MSLFDTRPKVAVHVAQTGEQYPCASNESLLTGMLRLGHKGIPVGCVNGGCGVCKVRILQGQIKSLGPISRAHVTVDEEDQGYTLACRVAPTTPVHLEVAGKLNKPFSKGRAESATASPSPQQQ
ncbi:MAG: 2Fe-2S iron-sulfur cluster binding domain-containing protein [Hydrogenophaga sp.]|uniref:2Fe-2S iron-sulfur cluster binding domain-containing protein n=1 Tax=Hydrogenophaga sp. TaxID=1904254 RepID=UPI002759E119|nr:2Fe-2S iron-sulfur cluster binding domain-containing protein [Hydrogenophaga sp.]MDP2416002.1 2Fe-2S iron-sulfur cluster binding domain-containing protein [Hydrogenophaga sp.]MDZ4127285.1 2Fe-2S iron-sulfur cluster binding domain-containing protein [Hydrogenophaga sp.]MDZ4176274.1 2Fe-2S iron-sulfur cluster binding domain-containing protein [Hydrogenophaga sp.]